MSAPLRTAFTQGRPKGSGGKERWERRSEPKPTLLPLQAESVSHTGSACWEREGGQGCRRVPPEKDACIPTGRGTVPASRQAGGRCLQPDRQEKDTCSPTGRGTVPASRQAALPFSLKPPAQIYLPPSKDVNCTLLKS